MTHSIQNEPQRASGTVRRFVRILMFHVCALIALIILCPFRYAFEMVAPLFRWGIRNWVAFNLPSLGDYWTSAISPSALRMQRDFIFANPTGLRAGHLVDGTQHPVVLPKDLNVSSENRQASRPFRGTGTASASSKGNSPNAHLLKTHKEE